MPTMNAQLSVNGQRKSKSSINHLAGERFERPGMTYNGTSGGVDK